MKTIQVLITVMLVVALGANAAETVNYRGTLPEVADAAVTLTFNIYSSEDGAEPFVTETRTVDVVDGAFEVALPTEALVDTDGLFIEVLSGDEVVIPREPLLRPSEPMAVGLQIGSATEELEILSSSVGIGTATPGAKLDVAGNVKSSAHFVQGTLVSRPYVTWSASGTSTGAIIIKLPGTVSNYGMLHVEINVYEYSGLNATTYIIGGHNWNSAWYNYGCNTIGLANKKVRVAVKDGQYAIVIGEPTSSWSYGHVVLSKITTGGYYSGVMDLGGAYSITQDATSPESYTWISGDLNRFNAGNAYFSGDVNIAGNLTVSGTFPNNSGWTDGGTNVYLTTSSDKVGIGTSPSYKLDVYGATGIRISESANPYRANLVFGRSGSWDSGIRVYDNGDAEMRIWHMNANGQIVLATGYNGNMATSMPTDGLFIDHNKVGIGYASPAASTGKLIVNGNVGIGTTSPSAKLDVRNGHLYVGSETFNNPGSWASTINLDGSSHARILIEERSSGTQVSLWAHTGGNAKVGTISNHNFGIIANGGEKITVQPSGNVGIGTSSPGYKLDVNGTSNFSSTIKLPGVGTNEIQYGTGDQANYSTYNFAIRGWWGVALKDYSNTVRGVYDFRSGNLTTDGVLSFNGSGNNYLAGNVGIGVTSPTEKLSVNGALVTQNGKVKRDFAVWNTTASSSNPIHIKTNITWSNIMYRILVEGYNYGAAQPINSEVVGYTYPSSPSAPISASAVNHASGASISQYKSEDGYLVVKLSSSSFYYVGLSVSAWLTNPAGNSFDIKALLIVQQASDLVSSIIYSQSFTNGVTSPSQCTAWNTFRASLTGTYSSIKMKGTYNTAGIECTGAIANTIAQALRNGTTGSWSCGGYTWYIGSCGPGIELAINQSICSCPTGYSIRPCIGNTNWGGVNTATCSGPTQTMTVEVH